LRDQLAHDAIPALEGLGGDYIGPYGEDGQSPGWIFMGTNPTYPDQLGSICKYLVTNPNRYPKPVMGFMDIGGSSELPYPEARAYCGSLGIHFAGASRFPEAATNIQPQVQKLIDAGVNIIYTQARLNGTALIARTLKDMRLQGKITLIGSHVVLDLETFTASPLGLDENGIPFLNGMIGSMPTRSWFETNEPGIQLIIQQADLHQRSITDRTNSYIRAWIMTDLFIETYIRTGNRVGFDHVTGVDIKATLENLVYSPLGGVDHVDFRNGRRALSTNRIGQLNFLGQDGKTPARPGNPPMVVTAENQQLPVPIIMPLTDYQSVPDLRPGGVNVPTSTP
jgi:ABC-type branched-subunit amino acid transport system substrate-binding protein